MDYQTLLFERREGVAHVTLNRPDKLNALNSRLVDELRAAAGAIRADAGIRAVLLTGAGRGFSSGADLTGDDFLRNPGRSFGGNIGDNLREHFNPMVLAWHDLGVPLVVAVNGVAAGAGMSLALLGDIVLAAQSASFLQLFAPRLGLMPDLGSTYLLPRLVGCARAKGLSMLGQPLSAADAARWGLIWAAVDDDSLMEQAQAMARTLATGPTQALKRIKAVFDAEPASALSEQLEREAVLQAELGDTQDFAEGLQAFRGKRTPAFSGR